MSIVKQIIIAILATVLLVVFGFGSYFISRQVLPDPTAVATTTPTTQAGKGITVDTVKKLVPKNVVTKQEGKDLTIQFDTAEKSGSVVYVTPVKKEKISQVIRDWGNGVPVSGVWYNVTPEGVPSSSHLVKVPVSSFGKATESYFYIVLLYQSSRIMYGGTMDFLNGPTEPYTIKLNP